MQRDILSIVKKYIDQMTSDEFHRFKSWDNCFGAFDSSSSKEIKTLELAFYLASWGMYRGSSGLLQKNHLIHKGAVDILLSDNFKKLKCNQKIEVARDAIDNILSLKNELFNHYSKIYFKKGTDKAKPISATDTLLSKIMLGSLGCVPAYDRYFISGLKKVGLNYSTFELKSLHELMDFIAEHESEILGAQEWIKGKTLKHYPLMKIIDMYFWQIGFDQENYEKKKMQK